MTTRHRRRLKTYLCILACTTISASACGGTTTPPPSESQSGPQHGMLKVAGQTRTYILFRPPLLDAANPAPLVVALHGYTSSAAGMEGMTLFDAKATKGRFVVAYAEGLAQSWNAGSCCGDAQSKNIDDVAFISQLIDRLLRDAGVDPKRVFVTGMSNGGMMAQRLACEISDRITAVASVSGALAVSQCHPTRAISILEMHGTDDPVVPFEQLTGGMMQWASLDGCAPTPKITEDGSVKTTTWTTCRDGVTVVLQAVIGADHTWFGSEAPGQPDATSVVWDFFKRAPSRA